MTKQLAVKYKKATKKEKGEILDSVIALTGYNRSKSRVLGRVKKGKRTITLPEQRRVLQSNTSL